jgi:putative transcriptional regulator
MNNLKKFRTALNLTQKDVAIACNISERQYIRYEQDQQLPSVYIAIKLAEILNTTVENLYYIDEYYS